MDKIESKLQEAFFFYTRMTESADFPAVFVYYLSAFLSASRSVLQYIELEVIGKPGTDIGNSHYWFSNVVAQNDIIKFFKDKRDINIHEQPAGTKKGVGIEAHDTISISESVAIEVKDSEGNIKGQYFSESNPQHTNTNNSATIKIIHYFNDWTGNEDILELSKKYLEELNKIISETGRQKLALT